MRIRHGSLAGHLRGPLEQLNLIVGKDETTGKYEDNVFWADRLDLRSNSQRAQLFNRFHEYSARYDAIVEDLTKNKLQILRKEKPDGMFFLHLRTKPIIISFLRSRISENTTFSEFLDWLFAGIEISLHRT